MAAAVPVVSVSCPLRWWCRSPSRGVPFADRRSWKGVCSKWRWALVHRASTGIAVHTYATHGRADQALHARPYGQMRARHLLSVPCARAVHVRLQMPCLCTPMIGRKTREPQGLQQGLQLQQNRILTTPKAIREDCTRVGIARRGLQSCRCVHWLRAPEATPQYTMRAAETALVWPPHPCPTSERPSCGTQAPRHDRHGLLRDYSGRTRRCARHRGRTVG
jgi:hypothetical protein